MSSAQTNAVKTPRTRIPGNSAARGAVSTIVIVALGLIVWTAGSVAGAWNPGVLPAPGDVARAFGQVVASDEFGADLLRTTLEVGMAFVAGSLVGLILGIIFWRWQPLGKVFEPYLVAFYAVPLVLFYPIMIVVVGINLWSVVILASIMALIPMTLNTWIGLSVLKPVYVKLGKILRLGHVQFLAHIALPGAAPYIMAGIRMAAAYALIGSVAMEFTTASAGLGFRIRYLYESFDNSGMYAYVLVILFGSFVLTGALALIDRFLIKGKAA